MRGARKLLSPKMNDNVRRPFYAEYAWAFNLLIDRPVRKECATMVAWLVERGVRPGAELLDAGCGTGRHAAELARRGYIVHGIDLSPELIDVARQAGDGERVSVSFAIGDIKMLPINRFDAILCRGVLNDFVEDQDRKAVFATFARALRPGGVLILDVREWEASAERKAREPLFRKSVSTDRGTLTFSSVTDLDPENRRLLLSERHTLVDGSQERSSDYQFVMRCWTPAELQSCLTSAGFPKITYFGAYDDAVQAGRTDRLVAVAQLSDADMATGTSREFEIRPARLGDAEAIRVAHVDSIRSIGPAYYPPNVVEDWGSGLTPDIYVKAMEGGEVFFVATGIIGGKPAVLGFSSHRVDDAQDGVSVYVRAEASRQGIGTALLQLAEKHALDIGATSIQIQASLAGVEFYKANGFEEIGRGDALLMSGRSLACVFMRKVLTW